MEPSFLGTSPRSSILFGLFTADVHHHDDDGDNAADLGGRHHQRHDGDGRRCCGGETSLEDLARALPGAVALRKELGAKAGSPQDPIQNLFERVRLDDGDWTRFAFTDPHKNYTRNLVATDHETYTLLLLCWNPRRESPVHDHPCDGCWMRVLRGKIRECRYREREGGGGGGDDKLVCTQDVTYSSEDGGVVFIEDSLGYHKVGDASPDGGAGAVTLHLYSPPFSRCRIWLDDEGGRAGAAGALRSSCQSLMCNYSEYGEKVL